MPGKEGGNTDEEIYNQLLSTHGETQGVVLETQYGELDFTVTQPSRAVKNRVQSRLPEGMFDALEDLDIEPGASPEEVSDNLDLGEVDLKAMTLGDEATEAWDEMILDSLEHDRFQEPEIEPLIAKFSDEVWYGIGGIALKLGADTGAIHGFREK